MAIPIARLASLHARYDGPIPDSAYDAERREGETPQGLARQYETAIALRHFQWTQVRAAGLGAATAHRRLIAGEVRARSEWRRWRRVIALELDAWIALRARARAIETRLTDRSRAHMR